MFAGFNKCLEFFWKIYSSERWLKTFAQHCTYKHTYPYICCIYTEWIQVCLLVYLGKSAERRICGLLTAINPKYRVGDDASPRVCSFSNCFSTFIIPRSSEPFFHSCPHRKLRNLHHGEEAPSWALCKCSSMLFWSHVAARENAT